MIRWNVEMDHPFDVTVQAWTPAKAREKAREKVDADVVSVTPVVVEKVVRP